MSSADLRLRPYVRCQRSLSFGSLGYADVRWTTKRLYTAVIRAVRGTQCVPANAGFGEKLDLMRPGEGFWNPPQPPRFTLQRSQPMRLASLFPGTNSPRVRSISGLLLASESFPHFSPCRCPFQKGCFRQSMFRTDTTGTPTRINRVCCASVSDVPETTISG